MRKPKRSRRPTAKARPSPVVGVAWYTQSEWARVKASAVDPERFEASFDEWVAMAEEALDNMGKVGVVTRKFLVDADELHAWCRDMGMDNDAATRARFVAERMKSSDASDK